MLAERGVNGIRSHHWLLHAGAHYCQTNFFSSEVHSSKYHFLACFFSINKLHASLCFYFLLELVVLVMCANRELLL